MIDDKRPSSVRAAILGFLSEPRHAQAVADHIGCKVKTASSYLVAMYRLNLVRRVGYGVYARIDYAGPVPSSTVRKRPQPIRDAILVFLSEPRSARAVADHIGRPVPTATGHLAAMRRRNLVQRLGYSAYARADYAGAPVEFRRTRAIAASPAE